MIERFVRRIRGHYPRGQKPAVIFEVGSRDALQAVEFARTFPEAKVYAFECNPSTLPRCFKNAKPYPNITVVDRAVHVENGRCRFYPIDTAKSKTFVREGNPGASSLFRFSGTYKVETLSQKEIDVEAVRLDTYCSRQGIAQVDLLWLDLQGAELMALQSLGGLLATVKMIHTEVEFNAIYEGQCLFGDVENYLLDKGFLRLSHIKPKTTFADLIYINTRYMSRLHRMSVLTFRTVNQILFNIKYGMGHKKQWEER